MLYIVALIAIIGVYIALAAVVLPRLVFRTRYSVTGTSDRCVKSAKGKGSRDIVFSPSEAASEYISRYALSDRDGKRVLVCKLNKSINYIDYDVVVFDGNDKVKRVFNVKDGVQTADYTHVVELPFDTEYVSLIVNEVDGERLNDSENIIKNVSGGRIFLFLLINSVLLAAAVYGVRVCMGYALGGLYAESFMRVASSNIASAIVAAALIVINITVTMSAFAVRRKQSIKAVGNER